MQSMKPNGCHFIQLPQHDSFHHVFQTEWTMPIIGGSCYVIGSFFGVYCCGRSRRRRRRGGDYGGRRWNRNSPMFKFNTLCFLHCCVLFHCGVLCYRYHGIFDDCRRFLKNGRVFFFTVVCCVWLFWWLYIYFNL